MATSATPVTATTPRRHHSTGRVASAKAGTIFHECEDTAWTIEPSATATATCSSGSRTLNTINAVPSAVRTPARTQSTGRTPERILRMPSLIA